MTTTNENFEPLDPGKFEEHHLQLHSYHPEGERHIFKFPNGRGASVIRNRFTYGGAQGKFELGVVLFREGTLHYELDYSTPITEDVLGHLTPGDVIDVLQKIWNLPKVRGI